MLKLSIITLFLGQTRNRFLQYGAPVGTEEVLGFAGETEGCDGVELRYPADFSDVRVLREALQRNALSVSAINFGSVRNDYWLRGAWTSENAADRRDAVDDFKRAIDLSAELGAYRVTNCPLNDGFDYPFEMDYVRALDYAAEYYAEVAAHNPEVKVCIEYKISEPRVRSLLGNAGETLAFCQMVGAENLGVTMDTGHAMFANENSAASAAMLARAGKLFYVHLNDNDGRADWDLTPGSVHTWEFIELFYFLKKLGYDDWFTFDIVPKEHDARAVFAQAAKITNKLKEVADRIDYPKMDELLTARNPTVVQSYLHDLI